MASKRPKNESSGKSRIPSFFKMTILERISALNEKGMLSSSDVRQLTSSDHQLNINVADKMIENVVGVFGLPMGVALNFLINNQDYVVPLAVEEPSIVAGLSGAARISRLSGGFTTNEVDTVLIGQVQSVISGDPGLAVKNVEEKKSEIISLANSLHPKMVARGGGVLDIEVYQHKATHDSRNMVVVHLLVDTREAMGANLVNAMCEAVASLVETLTQGKVFLRILSNLTDRAIAKVKVEIPTINLAGKGFSGEEVRDGIVLANDLALVDPYRAATHNKGIMNGVDAVAIATGNDWRAIEAAAHAYAAKEGHYKALTEWYPGEHGDLIGEITIPMKVGTVGGSLETNPSVKINHRLLGSPSASELAGIMASVGLAQNFAALRSLSTDGIQQNHMTLHARSVASSAGVNDEYFEAVVDQLIESGEIKVWKAKEIASNLARKITRPQTSERQSACGKIILLGEHAVVYGRPAIALPIPLAVEASVRSDKSGDGINIIIPRWGLEQKVKANAQGFAGILADVIQKMGLDDANMEIDVFPNVPKAMGLGGSSALAVAIIRAIDHHFGTKLSDQKINELAYECEKAAHGTPSGVDNTVATFGTPLFYKNAGGQPQFEEINLGQPIELVVGITGMESLTAETVTKVRNAWTQSPERYESLFDQIAQLTLSGLDCLKTGKVEELGELMNICHGYLNALQLSTPELEELVHIARSHGALGAKLTGGGGGGSMIALCQDNKDAIEAAMNKAGYKTLPYSIG